MKAIGSLIYYLKKLAAFYKEKNELAIAGTVSLTNFYN